MKHTSALLPFLLVSCVVPALAQNPPQERRPEKSEDVVRVTTNLVQLDAIVTDKSGRLVVDLRPEDFELFENGIGRQITQFSYVSLTQAAETTNMDRIGKSALRTNPTPMRPEQVRRAIAILVDDFGLSFESTANVRNALEKFIEEQTMPNDLVAVIRTSGGPGAIQQFTADRQQLLATIKRLRWYATGRGRMSAVDSIDPINNDWYGLLFKGYQNNYQLDVSGKEFFPGTLGALGFVIQRLGNFPGRKSIVLISDNLPVTTKEAQASGGTRALNNLIELANRHSVVIYTMDPRGITPQGLHADDNQYDLAVNQIEARERARPMQFRVEQDGLSYLAKQTGGLFIHDTNDLSDGLRRVLDDEQGYYLIAYRPDDFESQSATGQGRAHQVRLRLKRPGLEVRTRSGFHRVPLTHALEDATKTKEESLRGAIASPFINDGVRLKMTALFTGEAQVRILLHVDSRDVGFTQSTDNAYNGSFEVAAVAFDDNGRVTNQVARTQTLRVPPDAYQLFLRDGFVYSLTMPIQVAGTYQVRLALRDGVSGRVGSDCRLVEVPDIKKRRLTLSGFIVQGIVQDRSKEHPPDQSGRLETRAIKGSESGSDGIGRGPAVRRFAAGDVLGYSYLIYGARRDAAIHFPELLSEIRIIRAGKEVFTSGAQPLAIAKAPDTEGIVASGSLRLGLGLPPGEYLLQVAVTDKLAPADKQSSDQWIDFEIVK